MGAFDKMKDKAQDLVGEHGEKAKEGVEKAGDIADEKTGGKHSDKI
ncbi:MAG: antitoxin, partial [Acidimicrobiia bacterium]